MGLAARRGMDRTPWKSLPLFAAGQAIIFAVGVPWLAVAAHLTAQQALEAGFYPFIVGGIVKAAVAAGVLGGAWAVVHRRSTHR
jgi:biotin transport system substrate-specific component